MQTFTQGETVVSEVALASTPLCFSSLFTTPLTLPSPLHSVSRLSPFQLSRQSVALSGLYETRRGSISPSATARNQSTFFFAESHHPTAKTPTLRPSLPLFRDFASREHELAKSSLPFLLSLLKVFWPDLLVLAFSPSRTPALPLPFDRAYFPVDRLVGLQQTKTKSLGPLSRGSQVPG
jgi:hypothetical protein